MTGKIARSVAVGWASALVRLWGGEQEPAETWNVHGQTTLVEQAHPGFPADYSGQNSLDSRNENKDTDTITIFLGLRGWGGAEIYFNPEFTQGYGLSGTVGVAGFPNGEGSHAGSKNFRYNTSRLFLRQTINLGGGNSALAGDKNQLAGSVDDERLVFSVGKFAANDFFDGNKYSHDARAQFLNWALVDDGAWDFPADAKGYTAGFVAEWIRPARTFRWGVFMEPKVANERTLDTHLAQANGQAGEWQENFSLGKHAATLRALVYWNRAHMGNYENAIRDSGPFPPAIATTRSYRSKVGGGLNWEEEISANAGIFARAGLNDGRTETWAYTEIDRSLSAGVNVQGAEWQRPQDTVGYALVVNGLSGEHRRYLAAGGYGFIVGDGRLSYASEEILETYYNFQVRKWLAFALDYQFVEHPGYNRDRGHVSVFALRAHAEF